MTVYINGVAQGGGAPTDADYLVGTTQGGLSAEIVAGAAPAGELGGTWAAPTVDATHSGSAHHTNTQVGHGAWHGDATVTTHHTAFVQADHDALANPHHSNANDHAQAHGPAQHTTGTAWRLVYQDANGDEQEIALGAADTFLRSAGASAAPAFAAVAAAGLTRVGGNTTEATTTSTSDVAVMTIASLSIAVGTPVKVILGARKTTGAAVGVYVGMQLNTTVIRTNNMSGFSTTNQAENIFALYEFTSGVANYLYCGKIEHWGHIAPQVSNLLFTAPFPAATLTQIVIRGQTDNAAVTLGVDEVHIYTHAVS